MPTRRSSLAGAAVAAIATLALAPIALAAPDKPVLNAGDERAVAYDKNVAPGHDDACTVGGLTGTPIAEDKLTFTGGGEEDQYLSITAVQAGLTVTGVVVKGSDAFNVYLAAKLGPLPWNKLRSPDNNGGNIPTISHWYACGVKDQTQTSTVTIPSTPTSTSTSSSAPTSSSSEVAATTTTTSAVAVAGASDPLASTGFGSAWLLGLGAALVAAGAGVLLVLRRRRA